MANKPMSDDIISEMTKKMLSYFRSKDTNKKNAKKRVTKAQKEALSGAGGFTKLQLSRQADAAKKKKMLAKRGKSPGALGGKLRGKSPGALGGKTSVKQAKMAMPKKRPASISALSVIKKDTNIKSDKAPTKKVIVTKEQLKKSGLSLRDYMNFLKSQKTGRKISRDSRFDKKKKNTKGANT
tara:strand:+ start:82 stop:627 length:546 start_codon:yes stop_codon:yes gene_type:complete